MAAEAVAVHQDDRIGRLGRLPGFQSPGQQRTRFPPADLDGMEYFLDFSAQGLCRRVAGQPGGNRIDQRDPPFRIGDDDAIADGLQRHFRSLRQLRIFLLRPV